jgi:glycerophosphoryl diester phosphodiesterase
MIREFKSEYWLDKETYIAFCGDICTDEEGITTAREVEYQSDLDRVVITDVFWDKDEDIVGSAEIDGETLHYYNELGDDAGEAPITREEYDELATNVKKRAGVKVHVYKDNKIVEYTPTEFVVYRFIDEDNVDGVTCETLESAKALIDKHVK